MLSVFYYSWTFFNLKKKVAEEYTGSNSIFMNFKRLQTYHIILRDTNIHGKTIIKGKVMREMGKGT